MVPEVLSLTWTVYSNFKFSDQKETSSPENACVYRYLFSERPSRGLAVGPEQQRLGILRLEILFD